MSAEVDDELEVAITDEWRREMKQAREDAKLTQTELARRVGADQETISMIENQHAARPIRSSRWVLKIARELAIAPPLHHLDDWQRYWSKLGYLLAAHSERKFQDAITTLRNFLPSEKMPDEPKPRARSVGRAGLALPAGSREPDRAGDETPAEVAERKRLAAAEHKKSGSRRNTTKK